MKRSLLAVIAVAFCLAGGLMLAGSKEADFIIDENGKAVGKNIAFEVGDIDGERSRRQKEEAESKAIAEWETAKKAGTLPDSKPTASQEDANWLAELEAKSMVESAVYIGYVNEACLIAKRFSPDTSLSIVDHLGGINKETVAEWVRIYQTYGNRMTDEERITFIKCMIRWYVVGTEEAKDQMDLIYRNFVEEKGLEYCRDVFGSMTF